MRISRRVLEVAVIVAILSAFAVGCGGDDGAGDDGGG
jgi:hypothetical protein